MTAMQGTSDTLTRTVDAVAPPAPEMKIDEKTGAIYFHDIDGSLDRETGPAVIFANGEINYYRHGRLHRSDGPAMIVPGDFIAYYCTGMLHRSEGAAVIHADGSQEFWLYGEHVSTVRADGSIFADHFRSRTLLAG